MEDKKTSVEELIAKTSKKCEIFSNPLRTFIAVFIAIKEEVTWTELKTSIEKYTGKVNPNTLSFHLGELSNIGYITKINVKGQPRYKITEGKMTEIKRLAGEELLQAIKEKF
jgi:DNA-binding transcriptional ArsR family regulator